MEFTCARPKGEVFSCIHPPKGICPTTKTKTKTTKEEEEDDRRENSFESIDEDYLDNVDPSILVIEEIDFIYKNNASSDELEFLDESSKYVQMVKSKQDLLTAFFHQHSVLLYLVAGVLFLILLSQIVFIIYRKVNEDYEIYQAVDKNDFPSIQVQ